MAKEAQNREVSAAPSPARQVLDALRVAYCKAPIFVERKRDFLNLFTESDVVVASMAGQVYEFEIKISRADFLRDAAKLRNRIYSGVRSGRRPNRFWYATPPALLSLSEIPEWAGLLEIHAGEIVEVKPAPVMTRECHGIKVLMCLARAMRDRQRRQC